MNTATCLAVMYHYVRDSAMTAFPAIRALPPALFLQQLDWLQREYTLVGIQDLHAAFQRRAPLPANAAVLTFDDGFVDHYAVAFPILRRRGVSGVFFLAHDACGEPPRVLAVHKTHFLLARLGATELARAIAEERGERAWRDTVADRPVFGADRWEHAEEREIKNLLNYELSFEEADRLLDSLFARYIGSETEFARDLYLNGSMVAEMAGAGMAFGYHTRTHRMLSRLPRAEQERELREGVAWIRSLTGQEQVPFCYPWGGRKTYTPDTLDVLDRTGYSLAFNTVRRRIAVGRDGRFELPRVDTRDLPPYTLGEPALAASAVAEDA